MELSSTPSQDHVRYLLELSSFAATTVLMIVGVTTLLFTAAQLREASNTRIATIFLQVTEMWSAEAAFASRQWLNGLDDKFNDAGHTDEIKAASTSSPDYIRRMIEKEQAANNLEARRKTCILPVLENIGVLCSQGFVPTSVVISSIGAPIVWQLDLLAEYVGSLRKDDPLAYCHAAELYRAAKRTGR